MPFVHVSSRNYLWRSRTTLSRWGLSQQLSKIFPGRREQPLCPPFFTIFLGRHLPSASALGPDKNFRMRPSDSSSDQLHTSLRQMSAASKANSRRSASLNNMPRMLWLWVFWRKRKPKRNLHKTENVRSGPEFWEPH